MCIRDRGQHARPAEAAGGPLAVQVPQGQAVLQDVQVRMPAHHVLQRIHVRDEVAAHAVGVDQLLDAGDLVDLVFRVDLDVRLPAHRLVGDAQGVEDLVVEVLLAQEQAVNELEELAGAGTLDDAVIIGRGQRQDLRDRQSVDRLLAGALVLGRVRECADTDDAALSLRQARNRVDSADAAGVRQRDGGAGEVVSGELAFAGTVDEVCLLYTSPSPRD